MVIAIGANGDGVLHWRHYVHHHCRHWIAIGTIYCRHWRQWRQWREPQIVMTLLPMKAQKANCVAYLPAYAEYNYHNYYYRELELPVLFNFTFNRSTVLHF